MSDRKSDAGKVVQFPTGGKQNYNAETERALNIIGSRIRAARKSQKISMDEFSALLSGYGVFAKKSAIGKWEQGDSIPSAYQLIAIAQALHLDDRISYFTNAMSDQSLNETGLQRLEEYRKDLIASGRYKLARVAEQIAEMITVKLGTLPVSAGPGEFLDWMSFEEKDFPKSVVPVGTDFALYVSGDSMEPIYKDGQIVYVQKCETLLPGEVGIFVVDGTGYVKEYREQTPEDTDAYTDSDGIVHKQPVLISYNEKYDPRVISPYSNFSICGRVLN